MIEDIRAPLFIAMDDHLGVGIRSKLMALFLQLCSQFSVIVNLAVEDDPHRFFCVRHRLMTAGEIDDRQSPEAQTNRPVDEEAFIIRSTSAFCQLAYEMGYIPALLPGFSKVSTD